MKKLALGLLALIGVAGPALAADMPVKAPMQAMQPAYTWTGFYIGVAGGGAWGHTDVIHGTNDPLFAAFPGDTTGRFNVKGALIGVTAGYNWQMGQWVVGLEGDASVVSAKGSANYLPPVFNPAFSNEVKQRDLSTFRGRFGYLANPDLLVYATGGAALSDIQLSNSNGAGTTITDSKYVWGWTAGAGLEWKFAPRFSVKAEYLYVGLSDKSFFNPASSFSPLLFLSDQHVKLSESIVRVGLNWQLTQ
jgi:outer membrane immunogenic protein